MYSDLHMSAQDIQRCREKTVIRIVDDDASFRDALQCVLEMEGWQVREYASGQALLTEDSPTVPGVVVMDLRMPGLSGLETQHKLNERQALNPIIFLTGYGEVDTAVMALKKGAADFIQKPIDNLRLLDAIEIHAFYSLCRSEGRCTPQEAHARLLTLTSREYEIAVCLSKNLINRQIAEHLGIAMRTVEVHRHSVLKKLGLSSAGDIAQLLADAELFIE